MNAYYVPGTVSNLYLFNTESHTLEAVWVYSTVREKELEELAQDLPIEPGFKLS